MKTKEGNISLNCSSKKNAANYCSICTNYFTGLNYLKVVLQNEKRRKITYITLSFNFHDSI